MMNKLGGWKTKFISLFKQGLSPFEIFKSLLVSFLFTVIPIPGVTALIVAPIALKSKLNIPLMMGFSYILAPLQFILLMPFIRIGESVLNVQHTLLSVDAIMESFDLSFWITIEKLSLEIICALTGWFLVSFPTMIVLYYLGRLFFNLLSSFSLNVYK